MPMLLAISGIENGTLAIRDWNWHAAEIHPGRLSTGTRAKCIGQGNHRRQI